MFTTRPEIAATFGAVASTHWIASSVGMAVLERGGNAFDAAVAAGFTLQVVEPHLNGLGGDVPVIGSTAGSGEPFVLCGQGPSPALATTEAMTDLGIDLVPGTGLLPATKSAPIGCVGYAVNVLSTEPVAASKIFTVLKPRPPVPATISATPSRFTSATATRTPRR